MPRSISRTCFDFYHILKPTLTDECHPIKKNLPDPLAGFALEPSRLPQILNNRFHLSSREDLAVGLVAYGLESLL